MPSAPSPNVLRNRGVPVTVACLAPDPETGKMVEVFNADETVRTEERFVRVTNNVLVDIEDAWGNLADFAKATQDRPVKTVRKFLSLCWGEPEPEVGLRMLPGRKDEYATACAASIMLAQGVDPTVAVQVMEAGVRMTSAVAEAMTAEATKVVAEIDTTMDQAMGEYRGTSSAGTGSDSDSTSETSGT